MNDDGGAYTSLIAQYNNDLGAEWFREALLSGTARRAAKRARDELNIA